MLYRRGWSCDSTRPAPHFNKKVLPDQLSPNRLRLVLAAHRAIFRRHRQEELQQLQNVPVVPARLRRGALRGRAGPPHALLC